MHPTCLPLLACPRDSASPLRLRAETTEDDGDVLTGSLTCPDCGREYAIVGGVPDLTELGAESEDTRQKTHEIGLREAEAGEAYDQLWTRKYHTAAETDAILRHLLPARSDRVLELGCGNGRLSAPVLDRCGEFVGVDFSLRSLQLLRAKTRHRPHTHLVRADVNHLPLRPEPLFARIFSAQMFEHLPSAASRQGFLAGTSRLLEAGGRFVITTYNYSWLDRLSGSKQGAHPTGIYYYRYDAAELRRELARCYGAVEVRGIRNLVIPGRILNRIGEAGVRFDRLMSRTRVSRLVGTLLLGLCRPGLAAPPVPSGTPRPGPS